MAIKLVMKNVSDSEECEEFAFDQERISLGRDKENDLHIPDTSRVVSKRHAEISCEADEYEIVDLGSKNFTYLNSTRLESGRTYTLNDGDLIKVGEFEVEFVLVKPEPEEEDDEPETARVVAPDHDRTVFESSFVNPFADDAQKLVEALGGLAKAFEKEAPNRRIDALKDAFAELELDKEHELNKAVSSLIAVGFDAEATDPVVHDPSLVATNGDGHKGVPVEKALTPVSRKKSKLEMSEQMDKVLDVILNVLSMMVSIPWEFRHEFVGHTIAQTPESEVLFEGNGETMRNFLLNPDLDDEELDKRLALLEEGGDEVILHQLAMLDGYKAVVQQGMHMLLREIDPIVAAENLSQQGGLYKVFPNMARMAASWGLQEKFKDLRAEDWSVTERRAYRPSFIRAYLARMSAGPKKTSTSG